MKKAPFILLLLLSMKSFSQCTTCTSLDEAFKKPEIVKTLKVNPWLHNITLDSLPASIGLLSNLEVLYLSGHNIQTIPAEIRNLKRLRELSFAECKLKALPDEIFTLTNLRELILVENEFSEDYKKVLQGKFEKYLPNTKVLL